MNFAACRRAARSLRAADRANDLVPQLRPRFLPGLCRQRPPLAWQIWAASRTGRLVWRSPEEFCLLDPPVGTRANEGRLARWVDDNWPFAVAVGLTVMLLTAGTGAAVLFARSDATALGALGLVLAGMAVHIVFMITQLAHSVVEFVRSLGDQGHVDRIIDHHWSVRALHADGEAGVGELVGATSGLTGGAALVADLRRVSSAAARAALERLPDTRA